jgi:hypothetical protein
MDNIEIRKTLRYKICFRSDGPWRNFYDRAVRIKYLHRAYEQSAEDYNNQPYASPTRWVVFRVATKLYNCLITGAAAQPLGL